MFTLFIGMKVDYQPFLYHCIKNNRAKSLAQSLVMVETALFTLWLHEGPHSDTLVTLDW